MKKLHPKLFQELKLFHPGTYFSSAVARHAAADAVAVAPEPSPDGRNTRHPPLALLRLLRQELEGAAPTEARLRRAALVSAAVRPMMLYYGASLI